MAEPVFAQSKIAVVVNDTAITSYEISQRARLLRLINRKSASYNRSLARKELIDEALQLQEAKLRGQEASSGDVEAAFASIAKGTKLSPAQLTSILKRSGVNPRTLKERIRAQIAWSGIVRNRFKATVKVHEQEVISALRRKEGKEGKAEETKKVTYLYQLQQIVFIVPAKSPKSYRAVQRRASKRLHSSFRSCDTDLEKARGQKDVVVKKIGERLESDIQASQRKILTGVEVGRLTKPEESQSGFQMIAVCGKQELKSDAKARSVIEEELRERQGDVLARRYLRDLRRNAVIIVK